MAVISRNTIQSSMTTILLSLPWMEITAETWKLVRKLWRSMADEGLYEVLKHEVGLEIKDKKGKHAFVRKRQWVQYSQNNIIAYQDQGWGDGRIFVNYKCTPGEKVDRYNAGRKDIILISLKEIKRRGDFDEFNIKWEHINGFTRSVEQWGSEISHRTRQIKMQIIFPKTRPPRRVFLVEYLRRRTTPLEQAAIRKLPDGRWLVAWGMDKPRLNEQYSLKWEW